MINFLQLESYRENNRIEAKKSLGGFPKSFWETYSAFANTLGGIILLGVEERKDHSLHAVNLPDPQKLLKELWDTLNDSSKVSVNILTNKHVTVETVEENRIIVITVPRAKRYDKPVYIGGNALGGTYRRNGEGDYRCTAEEIEAMLRDASVKTPDMRVLNGFNLNALNLNSVRSYRERMKNCRPKHIYESLDDANFLLKIGALDADAEGALHPTAAGLLMFGNYAEITKEYPDYSLRFMDSDKKEQAENSDWCGNIFDFYIFVQKKLPQSVLLRQSGEGTYGTNAEPVKKALLEALTNCLLNADYHGKCGVEIICGNGFYKFSNAGSFRIDAGEAIHGGISDPRNGALTKMFNLIDVGTGVGGGLPQIYSLWERHGWLSPEISESFNPDRITLTLSTRKTDNLKTPSAAKADLTVQNALIIEYLTDHAEGNLAKLTEILGISADRTENLLNKLIDNDIIVYDDGELTYRLKR